MRSPLDVAEPASSLPLACWRIASDATLLHEGAPATALFVVRSGSVKCIRTGEDGYEKVLAFALPGDVLGYEALHDGRHPAGAVALEDTTAFALPLDGLDGLRQRCPELDRAMQLALSRQLLRAAGATEMMSAVAAEARLARFLLWLSRCMHEAGRSPRCIALRMSRRDIASLLGLAHETVSRVFTHLTELGLLRIARRELEILDLDGLRQRALITRRVGNAALPDTTGHFRRAPRTTAASTTVAAAFRTAGSVARDLRAAA